MKVEVIAITSKKKGRKMNNEITTKELAGIEDILAHYSVTIKKAAYYHSICSDKKIKKMCDDLYKKNVLEFQQLLNYLM